jgi:hypothetical protein
MARLGVLVVVAAAVVGTGALSALPASGQTAQGTLKVITLDRSGHAIQSYGVAAAVDGSNWTDHLSSGRTVRLPRGTYDVAVDIYESSTGTDTLAIRRVTVGATEAVVRFDARRGRRVTARLRPAPPQDYEHRLAYAVCVSGYPVIDGYNSEHALYVIPSSVRATEFAVSSAWQFPGNGPGDSYLALATHSGGLPNGMVRTFHPAGLATIRLVAKRGPTTGNVDVDLYGQTSNDCYSGLLELRMSGNLPFRLDARVPSADWTVLESGADGTGDEPHLYRGGTSYRVVLNQAAWGPGGELPYVDLAHQFRLGVFAMLADRAMGLDYAITTHYRLVRAGRTIVDRTGRWPDPVIHHAGWYVLTETATRRPRHKLASDVLSTRTRFWLRTYADPNNPVQLRGYLPRMTPTRLGDNNRAAPGSRTTVQLWLQRRRSNDPTLYHQQTDQVRTVQVFYSTNSGRSWHRALNVRHHGTSGSAVVPNPRTGYVSLRTTVVDTHGDTATATIIRAYAIK